ncbi:hypothetical protein QCD85_19330 [Paenibacillus sp. PsM32]|uniref:hypothetical protein n=1 Tax=unclassified Paenibacillus TaxID=185978 RepID=UPI00263A5CD3|nr:MULTISPECIES: hypothetical protein [unclassified Paenibacillus]MDN4620276.1 hypothetical protein [Paenibacillus sp. PsM32]MDQ1235984.1 hypothetical protein [Paenibacillus sp. SORGH_AS_0306]MDR6108341.1 hypothetical protein [Paenibacillus sp. SORGH_AS_0338]
MTIQKFQTYIDLTVANWEQTSLANTLQEIVRSQKQYEHDYVEVHQVVKVSKSKQKSNFLIIINITRNTENPGELVDTNR